MAPSKSIIVLGAGVTGLQTTLSLLLSPLTRHHRITLLASHFPGDLAPQYTSPWAGGHWRSHVGLGEEEKDVREFDRRTYAGWRRLLEVGHEDESGDGGAGSGSGGKYSDESPAEREKRVGLGFRQSLNFWGKDNFETAGRDGRGIWWRDVVHGFEVLDLKQMAEDPELEIPAGAVFGIKYQSICINIPRYLEYLFSRVKELGANIVKANIDTQNGLEGVIESVKQNSKTSLGVEGGESTEESEAQSPFALINCTGITARLFSPPHEAEKIFPIRGQTILVRGEARATKTYVSVPGNPEEELLYVVPRPGSGTTILGGCKQVGNWSEEVDEELNDRILRNVRRFGMVDKGVLRGGGGGVVDGEEGGEEKGSESKRERQGFEVLSCQVGFRPGRRGGPRVELEGDGQGKVRGVWVVHSYGHSGAGYQNSMGCAEKVVGIVSRLGS